MTSIISAEQLRDDLAAGEAIRLLDVRWRLDAPDGRPAYLEGHVPGAIYVSLDDDLADHSRNDLGRHPLPTREQFEATARRWGLDLDTRVVVYDDTKGTAAARAWWVLRSFGFTRVEVLDGGLRAWRSIDGELTGEIPAVVESEVDVPAPTDAGMTIDDAAAWPDTGVLLDARPADRYAGENEIIDPRAGHIPGAVSLPTTGNVDADGRFLPIEELRARFATVGAFDAPVGVYCGSGVAATHTLLALELVGGSGRLFPGSFSQWSRDASRPIATGPTP